MPDNTSTAPGTFDPARRAEAQDTRLYFTSNVTTEDRARALAHFRRHPLKGLVCLLSPDPQPPKR